MLTEAILFLVLVGSLSLLVACVVLSPAIVFWFLTKSALWIGFFLALLVAMVAVGGFVGLLLWPVTPIIAMMITVRYRETERRSLLWLLGVAAEKGIPLSTAVRAYADERHDALGRRAAALAEALDRGMPLDAALVASGNRLPTDALVAVRSGCESGGLAPALKDAASTAVRLDSIVRSLAAQAIYVIVYLCFATAVIGYIQYKIVPEFIKIFEGFQLKLPLISVFMVNACYVLVRDPLLAIVMYTGLVALFVFAMAKYMGLVRWDPPLVRRLWRRLDEAVIMRTLAQAVNEGRHARRTNCLAGEHLSQGAHPPQVGSRLCADRRRLGLVRQFAGRRIAPSGRCRRLERRPARRQPALGPGRNGRPPVAPLCRSTHGAASDRVSIDPAGSVAGRVCGRGGRVSAACGADQQSHMKSLAAASHFWKPCWPCACWQRPVLPLPKC